MGLFQRERRDETAVNYTVSFGAQKTKLIVGLGNPGAKYDETRHNVGFLVLDRLVEAENGSWSEKKALKAQVADIKVAGTRLLLVKPATFMNLSGEAVQAVLNFYKLSNQDLIVVHDELDIPFGQIRTRLGGSAAGHNGIKSVIQHCGEDFGRVRIGVKNELLDKMDSADFVLQKFNKTEQENLKALTVETMSILNEAIFGDTLNSDTRNFL